MFERKQKNIELFGQKFILSERNASDVIILSDFSLTNTGKDLKTLLYKALEVVETSLKFNYSTLPWYKYLHKRQLKKLLSKKHLLNTLTTQQVFSLAQDVFEMEGLLVETGEKKNLTQ